MLPIRLTTPLLALALMAALPSAASADQWMFQRSYYTHAPEHGGTSGPVSTRSGYREAFAGNHPRAAIRGGYRWNTIRMGSGASVDNTVIRENFFDLNY